MTFYIQKANSWIVMGRTNLCLHWCVEALNNKCLTVVFPALKIVFGPSVTKRILFTSSKVEKIFINLDKRETENVIVMVDADWKWGLKSELSCRVTYGFNQMVILFLGAMCMVCYSFMKIYVGNIIK